MCRYKHHSPPQQNTGLDDKLNISEKNEIVGRNHDTKDQVVLSHLNHNFDF